MKGLLLVTLLCVPARAQFLDPSARSTNHLAHFFGALLRLAVSTSDEGEYIVQETPDFGTLPAARTVSTRAVSQDGRCLVIDHIVPHPVTRLNDFPSLEFISLPGGTLALTRPWSGSRDVPLTVGGLIPIPAPAP